MWTLSRRVAARMSPMHPHVGPGTIMTRLLTQLSLSDIRDDCLTSIYPNDVAREPVATRKKPRVSAQKRHAFLCPRRHPQFSHVARLGARASQPWLELRCLRGRLVARHMARHMARQRSGGWWHMGCACPPPRFSTCCFCALARDDDVFHSQ